MNEDTTAKIRLLECARVRCGHICLKSEQSSRPSALWAGSTVDICPKCGNETFYILHANGRCHTMKDRDLPLDINPADIEPSPKIGLKRRRRILAAKTRALANGPACAAQAETGRFNQ